jgi:PTS system galactitol-specific IIA component
VDAIEISDRLALVGLSCATRDDVIRALSGRLQEFGFVRDTFSEAVLDRERSMPTGLITLAGGVAIPHTDSEHVIRSAIAIGLLDRPVVFKNMAAPEEDVEVGTVLLLAIAEKSAVMQVIANLADMFLDSQVLGGLKAQKTPEAAAGYLSKSLGT